MTADGALQRDTLSSHTCRETGGGRKMVKKASDGSCSSKKNMNKGAWTAEEDQKLADYVKVHGEKKWASLPARAGLNRYGKSCRMRWLNYLKPGIKRGNISEDEEDLIIRLHNLIGNRWSLIAGRLPGRTDNEIKNHWNTHLSKKSLTIDQLNWKLNQKNQISNDPFSTLLASDCSDLAAPSRDEWNRERSKGSDGPQLTGRKEQQDDGDFFDVDGLFDFSSMVPDAAESEPLDVWLQGSDGTVLEQQFTCNQLDFERLARWLEHEDDVFAFLSQTWQP